jgi:hypothetical protein
VALVAHPELNGQAECANQSVLHGLKPRLQVPLEREAGCWFEELPSILWGLRTSENRSTGFTPFFMVSGAEAVMLTYLQYDSPQVVNYTEASNEVARQNGLELIDEAHDQARSRTRSTSKGSAATTVAESALAPSRRATSSCGSSRTRRACTTSLHHGKGHSPSSEC